ncbi:MAG TPA: hypothetical protein VH040_03995 [Usitatibacter sp.]|jgi:hypothetical protein|nr:hypothetical protein [Usitatibacter sp.]
MKISAILFAAAALTLVPPAFAQAAFNQPLHDNRPVPNAMQPHARGPVYAMHPGARGFVHRPAWRHAVRVAHRSNLRFRFHGHNFVVLGGPFFIQPWVNYPYVSTPYYPATFYDPNEPDAGYNLYYCPNPAGYFPDVTDCPSGWWSTAPDDPPEVDPGY